MRSKFNDFVASFDLDYLIALGGPESSTVPDVGRQQTAWERLKNFPKGIKALLKDCIRYKSIHDASKTTLNAWTIKSPLKDPALRRGFFYYENEIRPGRIPRRQFEQQRQLKHDFRIMAPLILLWIPPIIGFLPPILAMLAPRQVMSRQFNNDFEALYFNEIEYNQRQLSFAKLAEEFWRNYPDQNLRSGSYFEECRQDIAGPVLDAMFLYSAFCATNPEPNSSFQLSFGEACTTIRELPRDYLETLSLSIGVFQQWPEWMSRRMIAVAPTIFLYRQVERISEIVCHDDALLLEEGHDVVQCQSLTDQEVSDACLMRGLPVRLQDSPDARRECLTNHLNMIAHVKRNMHGPFDQTDGFRLLTLHLNPLRYHLKTLLQQGKTM